MGGKQLQEVGFAALQYLGAATAVVGALEWALRDRHKRWLADRAMIAWVWLDDQRAGKFTRFLLRSPVQRLLSAGSIALFIIVSMTENRRLLPFNAAFSIYDPKRALAWLGVAWLVTPIIVGVWLLHPRATAWIVRARSVGAFFGRVTIGFATVLAVTWGVSAAGDAAYRSVGERVGNDAAVLNVIGFASWTAFGTLGVEMVTLYLMFMLSCAWLAFVWAISGAAVILRFVLLRVAENPKGPTVAIGGLLSVVGSILRALVK